MNGQATQSYCAAQVLKTGIRRPQVTQVYRKKYVIHVERVHREKTNGATVPIGVHPSSVIVTKIKLDKDRQALLDRKARTATKDDSAAQAVRIHCRNVRSMAKMLTFCACSQ